MLQFYRQYVADLRFHNPQLRILRESEVGGPLVGRVILVSNTGKGEQEDLLIESNCVKTVE